MRYIFTLAVSFLFFLSANAQTAIASVSTSTSAAASSFSYIEAGNTHNWGFAPNNTVVSVDGMTVGATGFTYASFLPGSVRLRRVDNVNTTGNFTLVFAEKAPATFNFFPEYQSDMEVFMDNNTYNKGADAIFSNAVFGNNIERLDWIMPSSFSTSAPSQVGFSVFERADAGGYNSFCIAAITAVDGLGNPTAYGSIVRPILADFGVLGPTVEYGALRPGVTNLESYATVIQSRGGVFISLSDLGITPGQAIFGYSLIAADLPGGALPADLVDFTNTTFFPTTTSLANGALTPLAVTGIFIANTTLPTRFLSFNAVENNGAVNLKWKVENETTVDRYEIERSTDGSHFVKVRDVQNTSNSTGANSYSAADNVASVSSNMIYYRIKQYDHDGSFYFSKIISIRRNNKSPSLVLYPNPTINNLYINIFNAGDVKASISIIDSKGAQVSRQEAQLANGNNSFTINGIEKLPKGVYTLLIRRDSGETITRQFLKQ